VRRHHAVEMRKNVVFQHFVSVTGKPDRLNQAPRSYPKRNVASVANIVGCLHRSLHSGGGPRSFWFFVCVVHYFQVLEDIVSMVFVTLVLLLRLIHFALPV
jgi:hypothetical protein